MDVKSLTLFDYRIWCFTVSSVWCSSLWFSWLPAGRSSTRHRKSFSRSHKFASHCLMHRQQVRKYDYHEQNLLIIWSVLMISTCADLWLLIRIYMYDGAFPDRGFISSFSGHVVGTFYIKVQSQSPSTFSYSPSLWKYLRLNLECLCT